MIRKIIFSAGIIFIFLTGCLIAFSSVDGFSHNDNSSRFSLATSPDSWIIIYEDGKTTIRNVTRENIVYTIKPLNREGKPEKKEIKPDEVHEFPRGVVMEITFQRVGREITYKVSPGKSYSFRYNENELLELYEGSHGREDAVDLAPYVPTPLPVVDRMLEMADLDEDDMLYDIGCGDGRIVINAAKIYGARGVGIDIDPQRIKESKQNAKAAGVEKLVKFIKKDALKVDISKATVVTLYLLPESNELLRPILEERLNPGVLVVSHNYSIPGWEDKELDFATVLDEEGQEHYVYLYKR
jgi:SAM-dependent methyltransferase